MSMLNPGSKGEHVLQEKFGSSKRSLSFYNNQMLDHLNPLMREFIAKQEMVFIGTSDAQGECDCSFRAGGGGFVRILGEKLLAYPEYRGQGVYASLGNISENPHIGMMFVDFFQGTIGLHVNGKARIVENAELLDFPNLPKEVVQDINCEGTRRPERWVLVEIEEAYMHCSKHIPLFKKLDKAIHWGTDDVVHKGGDYFKVKASRSPT